MAKNEIIGRIIFANLLEMPLQKYFTFVKHTEEKRLFKEWLDQGCLHKESLSHGKASSSPFNPDCHRDRVIAQYRGNSCGEYEVRYSHPHFQQIYRIAERFWHSFGKGSDEKRLLHRLRRINSRNALTHYLLLAIAVKQEDYLSSGNLLDLKCLTLVRLANQMQSSGRFRSIPHSEIEIPKSICPSWLSRIVRGLRIMLPKGSVHSLKALMPSQRDRLKCALNELLNEENQRIMAREIVSPYNDRELQELLHERFEMITTQQNVSEIRRETGVPSAAVRDRDFWHFLASPFSDVYPLTARETDRHVPQTSGVYELRIKEGTIDYPKGSSMVFYIGRSKNLRSRIMGYVRRNMRNENKIIARYLRSVPCNFRFLVVEEPYHAVEERQFYELFASVLGAPPVGNQVQPGISAEMKNKVGSTPIQNSKEYFDNVIRSMAEGLIVLSPKGTIQIVNQAVCTLLGYRQQELVGQAVTRIFAEEEEVPFRRAGLEKLMKKGAVRHVEKTYVAKDGRTIPVLFSGSVMRDAEGNIQGVVCVALDITERKRAEETLQESEEKFRLFFENEPEYCYIISSDGSILDLNPAALSTLGYSKKEIVGKPLKMIYALESHPRLRGLFLKWKDTGHLKNEEMIIITKKGEKRVVLLSAEAVRDKDGKMLHSVSVQRDITERKNLEQQIAEISLKEREKLQRDLHDSICQQLAGIGFLAKRMEQKLSHISADEVGSAAEIGRLASDTIELTQQIVRGLQPLPKTTDALMTALQELASHITTVYGIRCRFSSRKPVLIKDNNTATQLFLIVQEAVNNAARHSQGTRIQIRLSEQNNIVTVCVRDNGMGLPKSLSSQLPDPESKLAVMMAGMGMDIMQSRS